MRGSRLWFRNAMEGLFIRGLADVRSPELDARLADVGLRLERLENQYPVETFVRALDVAGPFVSKDPDPLEQQRELGRRFTRGYFATPLGSALKLALGLVGPRPGLARVDRTYRTVTNYLQARAVSIERNHALISFEPATELAGFLIGNGEASFELLHRGTSRTWIERREGERIITAVEWS